MIDLQGETDAEDAHVSVSRGGSVIFDQTVTKGTKSITLSGQTGTGTVTYSVVVNMSDGWEIDVTFTK